MRRRVQDATALPAPLGRPVCFVKPERHSSALRGRQKTQSVEPFRAYGIQIP
jgi:hypothetical protein